MANIALVVAQFNAAVTDQMTTTAEEAAAERNVTIVTTIEVPGVYDTPLAADRVARKTSIDAVAVVGAVVTGDTDHDAVIADAVAEKLTDISVERDCPITFGVSGPGMSGAEARERIDKGAEAVNAAADLVEVLP
jgi:6,7-dimethyl-8-ribityllumazine synthase